MRLFRFRFGNLDVIFWSEFNGMLEVWSEFSVNLIRILLELEVRILGSEFGQTLQSVAQGQTIVSDFTECTQIWRNVVRVHLVADIELGS